MTTDREPPPLVPSAEERAKAVEPHDTLEDGTVFWAGRIWRDDAVILQKRAYRDGWNAAQARIAELEAENARLRELIVKQARALANMMPTRGPSTEEAQSQADAIHDAIDGTDSSAPDVRSFAEKIYAKAHMVGSGHDFSVETFEDRIGAIAALIAERDAQREKQ